MKPSLANDLKTGADLLAESQNFVPKPEDWAHGWPLGNLGGRMIEIDGPMALTRAMTLVWLVQSRGGLAAWIQPRVGLSPFYPPDAEEMGVDLDSLAVLRLSEAEMGIAAEVLARSGAFELVVLDLGTHLLPQALQMRLAGILTRHAACVLCIRAESPQALGPATSLRVRALVEDLGPGRFRSTLVSLKDRRIPGGWSHDEEYLAPDGLA